MFVSLSQQIEVVSLGALWKSQDVSRRLSRNSEDAGPQRRAVTCPCHSGLSL